jgi:methylenetetrahydrofolate reductase (NADPH)
MIPLKGAAERCQALPPGSTVTVTASPGQGIEATLDLAAALAAAGHAVIPHLSAHMIHDQAHLGDVLTRCRAEGFTRAFVVGGDAKDTGTFHDGIALLRAIVEAGSPFDEIGIPSYPQGHVDISDATLLEALLAKQPMASYAATQMCFNPNAIIDWIARIRAAGVTLPIHLGIPGVAELTKLLTISAKIGVADSARYLKKNRKMIGKLLSPGSFGPDALLEGVAPTLTDPIAGIEALHVFTFNQVEATLEWQQRMLESLEG